MKKEKNGVIIMTDSDSDLPFGYVDELDLEMVYMPYIVDGKEYTEVVMNGVAEEDLPEVFGTDNYQVLLVANKYQTGFDQPKLCAMYVDKRLRGVAAVQTLSRLNRICAPFNKKTFVLDFKNTYEDIQNAFAPYYTETVLNETITPSDIRAVEAQVDQYGFLDLDDIEAFNEYLYQDKRSGKDKAKMWSLLDKSLTSGMKHKNYVARQKARLSKAVNTIA